MAWTEKGWRVRGRGPDFGRGMACALVVAVGTAMGGCGLSLPKVEMPKIEFNPWGFLRFESSVKAPKAPPPLMREIQKIEPDGTITPVAEGNVSAFQMLLRQRGEWDRGVSVLAQSILTLEVDVPLGDGNIGAYMSIHRTGPGAELRYYEQKDHLPRQDRFFKRILTAEEVAALDRLLGDYPFHELRSTVREGGEAVDAEGFAEARFRMTYSREGESKMVEIVPPEEGSAGAAWIHALRGLRDGGELRCVYFQPVPATSEIVFGDAFRHVMQVWAKKDEVRALISESPRRMSEEGVTEKWYALREGEWVESQAPVEDAEAVQAVPGTGAVELVARVQATGALVPADVSGGVAASPAVLQPAMGAMGVKRAEAAMVAEVAAMLAREARRTTPEMMPTEEAWWTEPSGLSTIVWHYVPVSTAAGTQVGFTVPGLVFGDEHMSVDAEGGKLYLVHDGVLFRLPIPGKALAKEGG